MKACLITHIKSKETTDRASACTLNVVALTLYDKVSSCVCKVVKNNTIVRMNHYLLCYVSMTAGFRLDHLGNTMDILPETETSTPSIHSFRQHSCSSWRASVSVSSHHHYHF